MLCNTIYFCGEIRKYQYFLVEKSTFLELYSTFNIDHPTDKIILSSVKGGLNSRRNFTVFK